MSNKRDLKAYVRYDGTGRVIPGSLILQRFKPKVGNWTETPAYECCNPSGCNNFWINRTFNPENPNGITATGSGMDSKCNSFMLMIDYWSSPNNPNQSSSQNFLLQKFNGAGDLVWNRVFDFEEDGVEYSYMDVQTISVDKEDNPICFLIGNTPQGNKPIIVKFDNDGNHIWSEILSEEGSFLSSYPVSVSFDASNNIYVSFYVQGGGKNIINIQKISADGVVLISKTIETITSLESSSIAVNSVGEVYVVSPAIFALKSYIIKLDSSLNEIWNKSYSTPGGGYYVWGIALDKDENIVLQIGSGASSSIDPLWGAYVKVSPAGNIVWTTRIGNTINPNYSLGTFQLNSDSDGNVYISSAYAGPVPGYTATSGNFIIISKLLPDGSVEWVYGIESVDEINSFWWFCPVMGNVVNNSLILGYYDDSDPYNAQLFKLPLTPVPDGVYGNYTFTNITNLWTTSSPALTLNDDTVTYTTLSTMATPLTYITFEGTYTTLHTSL